MSRASSYKAPAQFVAIQECSGGNESVGDMWLRTATFPPSATIADVHAWAEGGVHGGRLMIRPNESADATLAALEKGDGR